MRRLFLLAAAVFLAVMPAIAAGPELINVTFPDGAKTTGRLCLPDGEAKAVVVYIHGTVDASVPVAGVHDIEARFRACGKTNLKTYVFKGADYDLNFLDWIGSDTMPEGLVRLFDTAAGL